MHTSRCMVSKLATCLLCSIGLPTTLLGSVDNRNVQDSLTRINRKMGCVFMGVYESTFIRCRLKQIHQYRVVAV
ncbi:hypothetical protein BJV82DRAFT_627737 [Fennellomyces sp. T-0311]|nr:hypothetical protein BJV82DRAFT_627737 [Fennellomyces sp. T-0311]